MAACSCLGRKDQGCPRFSRGWTGRQKSSHVSEIRSTPAEALLEDVDRDANLSGQAARRHRVVSEKMLWQVNRLRRRALDHAGDQVLIVVGHRVERVVRGPVCVPGARELLAPPMIGGARSS